MKFNVTKLDLKLNFKINLNFIFWNNFIEILYTFCNNLLECNFQQIYLFLVTKLFSNIVICTCILHLIFYKNVFKKLSKLLFVI